MYTVFLAGSIASGKSTVAKLLETHGALRIDLDDVSREVCQAGSAVLARIAEAFGHDVIDGRTGELRRPLLAQRAFASDESTRLLESITHPVIFGELKRRIAQGQTDAVCVVETPLLDRTLDHEWLADEIACVVCPTAMRRERAVLRGMSPEDFDRRDAQQPTQEYLVSHAHTVFVNDADALSLQEQVDAWWEHRGKDK